jgi:RNA polymerase sigma-70 factor (ECF subfamily)
MTDAGRLDQIQAVTSRDEPAAPVSGTKARLRELFDMHAPYVWNTLRRFGVPPQDLEDLTHDVFVEVQRHLGDLDPSRPVKPWLFGFAFRVASHHGRRVYRTREVHEPGEAVDTKPPADAQLVANERRQLVLEALDALDLEKRAVFVLSQIDEVPVTEAARVLRIPLNTAYSRLRAARAEFVVAVKRLQAKRGER